MEVKNTTLIPFARYNYYNGGKKMERDARGYLVKELEFGAEWQAAKNLEIVVAYNMADRTTRDKTNQNNQQKGNFLRIQVQVNY
jgi:phosphate-selective porin